MENILEDVLRLEEEKIFPDELELSETYMESGDFTESEDISRHQLSSLKHKLGKLVKLNKVLNKFGYGYVDRTTGKLSDTDGDFSKFYHYLSPEEFEKARGGICWDYAEYQYRVLRKSGYDVINFYIELKDRQSTTHTITVVKFNDFYVYLESSFQRTRGVYASRHMKDIFNFVLNAMSSYSNTPNVRYEIHSYPGYDNYGCDVFTFMDHMIKEEKLIMKGMITKELDTEIRRFDESVEDFEEACKNLTEARNFCNDVRNIAKKYDANFFVVTDGASAYHNTGNPAVKNARNQQIEWEKKNGFDPDEDWSRSDTTDYLYESLSKSLDIEKFYKEFEKAFKEKADMSEENVTKYMKAIYLSGKLIGYVGFNTYSMKNKKYLGIGNFMVLKELQRSGHGSAIIRDIVAKNKDQYDQIYCYVNSKNKPAINFYKKIAKVGTQKTKEGCYYVIIYDKSTNFNESVDGDILIHKEKLNINTDLPTNYKKHLRLSDDYTGVIYLDTDSNMIGFVNTEEKTNGVWIQALEVAAKYQHKGYGRQLLQDAMKIYNAKYLSVRKTNTIAINLYKSMGFVIIDETDYMYAMSTTGKKEKVFNESYVFSEKDILYNKEKFNSGEINLCFITGLSGSGKTTLGGQISHKDLVEHYELDDVIFNWNFSDNNLKEYGDLIYSFFKSEGRSFRYHSLQEWKDDTSWDNKNGMDAYDAKIVKAFVSFGISYAASHKNEKIIIEGIQLYQFCEPCQFDDFAVFIKGTSMLKSKIRAAKRDSKNAGDSKKDQAKAGIKQFLRDWKFYTISEKDIEKWRKYFVTKESEFNESTEENEIVEELLLMEASIEHTFKLKAVVEKSIFTVLSTPEGRRKYKRIQDEYINRNMEKLSTAGPMYLIVFGDNDQKAYLDLFSINKEDIKAAVTEITAKTGSNSDFKFLRQNPILVVLYFCIRYFTLENDKQGVNATLAIFALGIYWSKFTKYFPKGVIGPVMEYTIDNMTEKFMIKKCGNIFNTLVTSINQSYNFHKKRFYEGGDDDVVAFMQRISNDQNSLLKKIANDYMKNYKEGKAVTTRNDDYDPDNPIVDDVQNASTIIQNQVSKVTLPIISNGVDLVLAEASARMAGISISDCREYLVKIMVQNNLPTLESLIESILFMFIYTYGRSVREIKSQYFLAWSRALFKKTNSNDKNLKNINRILEKWAEESGIYARYKREGSRINYKKGIFFYVILSIQKYS